MKKAYLLPQGVLAAALCSTILPVSTFAGDFYFDNNGTSVYPADYSVPANWNPDVVPGGTYDNIILSLIHI